MVNPSTTRTVIRNSTTIAILDYSLLSGSGKGAERNCDNRINGFENRKQIT
jgi:hypothetical protein